MENPDFQGEMSGARGTWREAAQPGEARECPENPESGAESLLGNGGGGDPSPLWLA